MKEITKKGILAGFVLKELSEDQLAFIIEQQEETKPSRLKNKRKSKKEKKKYND